MPDVALDLALLLVGLVLLTVGGDRFVLGAARLSAALSITPVLIGAVVIGFGTSLPELVVSVLAAARGSQDLALGNVVGSNTANMLLVLGAAAALQAMRVLSKTLRREVPIMLGGVALFALVTSDGQISLGDALALLVAGAAALAVLTRAALGDRISVTGMGQEVSGYVGERPRVSRAVLLSVVGGAAVLGGAHLLVEGASGLARAAGVSDVVIAITVVAVGTSLPELVTAVAAARRREADLVIGNVMGSNLFNALVVAGVAGLVDTQPLSPSFAPNVVVMLAACAVAAVLLRSGRTLSRSEGALMLVSYAGAITVAIVAG